MECIEWGKKTDSGHCLTSSRVLYKGVLKPGHDLGAISRAVLDGSSRFVVWLPIGRDKTTTGFIDRFYFYLLKTYYALTNCDNLFMGDCHYHYKNVHVHLFDVFVRFSHFDIKVCNAENVLKIIASGLVFSPRRLQLVQVD